MENLKFKNVHLNLVANDKDYMKSLIENIQMLRTHHGWSVRALAEKAEMPTETLQTFLKGKSKDCNLSTVVKLSRAFGVSMDELVGAETISAPTRQTIAMSRQLKEHHRYVIRMFAKHQYLLHGEVPPNSKQISVLTPDCEHGHLKSTHLCEAINVDHLQPAIKSEVCLGLKIPCDHYEPHYLQDEILLLGAHREGQNGERCVISKDGYLYICKKRITFVNGVKTIDYMSVINGKLLFNFKEIDDRVGYVIGFLNPDGSWGSR